MPRPARSISTSTSIAPPSPAGVATTRVCARRATDQDSSPTGLTMPLV